MHSNVDQEALYQICNFHDPRAGILVLGCGHFGQIVKMHNFWVNILGNKKVIKFSNLIKIRSLLHSKIMIHEASKNWGVK